MSQPRPDGPNEQTGPIEPVETTHVERVESTHVTPEGAASVERVETTHSVPAASDHVAHAEYTGPTGAALEERQSRGVLWGVLAGAAALLLVVFLWFAFFGPGRGSGPQTNVNLSAPPPAAAAQQPVPDIQLNVNLTQQARAAAPPTARPTTEPPTARPQPTSRPPVVLPTLAPLPTVAPLPEAPAVRVPGVPPAEPGPPAPTSGPVGRVVTAGAPPTGWRTVTDPGRACQYAAPPDWQVAGTTARAPNDRATATLATEQLSQWEDLTNMAKLTMGTTTTRDDSETRLWLERSGNSGPAQHFIMRPAGTIACVLQIEVAREGASQLESTLRQVADSLGAVR